MSETVHHVTEKKGDSSFRADIAGNFPLDESVIAVLPESTSVLSANTFGSSDWTITVRVDTVSADKAPKSFFLKCATEDAGKLMLEGEFNAMTELYKATPTLVPKPHAWGNSSGQPAFAKVADRILTTVIPRLLGVLQADGREIKPCLIHGDLWEGNIGTSFQDNEIYIFDAGAYYAHNEMEIGMWRCARHQIQAEAFTQQYLSEFPPSEPAEEWDGRNTMYCVKMNVIHSAHHEGHIVRQTAYEDMCHLVDKYAPWDDR